MKKFSAEEKEQILEESYKEGSVISEIGKKYKMSPKTIHAWRSARRKNEEGDNNQNRVSNFIEVGPTIIQFRHILIKKYVFFFMF